MSEYRRSPLQRLNVAIRRRVDRVAHWLNLEELADRLQRAVRQVRSLVSRLFAPRWLRRVLDSSATALRRAETSVARKGHQLSESVARSAVGEGAQRLARGGQQLEFRLGRFIVEGAKYVGLLLAALVPTPLRRGVAWLGSQIWWSAAQIVGFVGRWFRTRYYWHLVGAIPAFLLALPLAYCMIRLPFYSSDRMARSYRRAAQEAMQSSDYKTADLYYRKLSQLGASSDVIEFQAALTEFQSGSAAEALARIQAMAPEDRPGYAYAHVWLARRLLSGEAGVDPQEARSRAERHVSFALDRDPGNIEARTLRALLRQEDGRWRDAEAELRQVVAQMPERGIALAEVYARQGRWADARREVEKVLKIFEDKKTNQQKLDPYEYLSWSHGLLILGDNDRAEAVLREAYERSSDNSDLRQQLHAQLIANAGVQFDQRLGDPQQIVDRYLLAAELDPDDHNPLILLGNATTDATAFGQHVRESVWQLLDTGQPPAKLFAIVGPLVGLRGDMPRAVRYLRRAVESDPRDAYSLNNLAFCLWRDGPENDPEALRLVEQALEIEPGQPAYLETRGQILVRLGRYDDAIRDLTAALNALGDQPSIHDALAVAYERLGRSEQARVHRQKGTGLGLSES